MTEETLEPVETETDPEEQIRELTSENRRLRKQIKRMREAAATSKKVEFSKIIFCGVSIVTILITVFSCHCKCQSTHLFSHIRFDTLFFRYCFSVCLFHDCRGF